MIKEAVASSLVEVETKLKAGANRIELCENMHESGTTPSYGMVKIASDMCQMYGAELAVMIRPRGGSFVYNWYEFESMQADIQQLKTLPIDYFVFGCLTTEDTLHQFQMQTLIQLAAPIRVVCHMAFDHIYPTGQSKALQQLIDLGVTRLLTHGGPAQSNLFDNLPQLAKWVRQSKGQIEIMPGGGLNYENLDALLELFPFQEVHGTHIVKT
ncbi:copper homeostasis protein CutC [Staphylococcus delphini]|uniref:PF03932 family protein CutC n=1 Tax=Staphylococcus delphini TaxID=53344 RepID=A0AAP8AZD6_9STAP|nr:copper homeostasis protein CutC [Staphylococcus delphini]MDE9752324.1 copper homeostasis protein CutC [Staphylococcus delphini]MDE9789757.1 copper homeostasis protein CutC [Staphylococcus delphini]MDE9793145.1 copper homeostasis protein CutC [Staphylococcus delphini]MDE9794573.1 copper homeostasis protein CutC [Staphylococcus delphini]MDE9798036.1 copper homeostasis protein CutC [Staphylococcus delphini]